MLKELKEDVEKVSKAMHKQNEIINKETTCKEHKQTKNLELKSEITEMSTEHFIRGIGRHIGVDKRKN